MRKWLTIFAALLAAWILGIVMDAVKGVLALLAVGIAVAVVWGLNWTLGAPWYLIFVAVPLAMIAVWPLAQLIEQLD